MSAIVPPRAEHVGSLLRSEPVKIARQRFAANRITAGDLKSIEDEAIGDAVRLQESVGLKVVTDGEIRRSFWHYDFIQDLIGVRFVERKVATGIAGFIGEEWHGDPYSSIWLVIRMASAIVVRPACAREIACVRSVKPAICRLATPRKYAGS